MNIEKQATELVGKFREVKLKFYNVNPEFENLFYLSTIEAKQCAIICCETTIKTLREDIRDLDVRGNVLLDLIDRWQQVKNYIENNL